MQVLSLIIAVPGVFGTVGGVNVLLPVLWPLNAEDASLHPTQEKAHLSPQKDTKRTAPRATGCT